MHIPPARRRRILTVHHLRQQGKSLRKIAEQLKISHATVHADLKLVETHWAEIALPAAADLLLNQLHIIQRRLARVLQQDLSAVFNQRLSPDEYTRLYAVQMNELATLLREARRTVAAVQRRAEQRPEQELDIPDFPEPPPEPATPTVDTPDSDLPGLTNANHSEQRISQPAQEIVNPAPSEKNIANHSDHPLPGNLFEEAQTFLEQLREQESHPPPVFADAAGGG